MSQDYTCEPIDVAATWRRSSVSELRIRKMLVEMFSRRGRKGERDNYARRVLTLHRKLGVPRGYGQIGIPFQREATILVSAPTGIRWKKCLMTPDAKINWLRMTAAAANDGITLLLYCAFRNLEEQAELIQTELMQGHKIDKVLTWIAAPGYSEHHTGRALDIGSNDCFPPTPEFANTAAFKWLTDNAGFFWFDMSYPKSNTKGIIFEPWHWLCREGEFSRHAL
jgi:D-alanyl-D-alanine carboxypeptidase